MKYPVILIQLLAFVSISCHPSGKPESEKLAKEITGNLIMHPQIILTRKDMKVIIAKSDKLIKNNNELALMVGNVKIDFFNDEGEHISTLYADSAKMNENNNNLKANGNVYVVSDSGYTLTTRKIIWDNNYKMILAEDSVLFTTTEGDTLYGIGFESDSDLEEWRIFRPFGIARGGI